MSDDEKMDELLIEAARDYNVPVHVPREAMWAHIAESRRATREATRNTESASRGRRWVSIAAAAAIIMAIGIVIGRRLERTPPVAAPVVASKPIDVPASHDSVPASPAGQDTIVPQLRKETQRTERRVRELASANAAPATKDSGDEPNLAYRLVMLRHVAGSEAMITAFRASARRGEVDAQMANWARQLLRTTRLLEASPVTSDPTMKRLLEDLDLVLVQIAQYVTKGTINTEELDLIEQSIERRSVITKLRSSLPGRNAPAGL